MLLQFFVGIIDAKLLKTVLLEALKAKDIENAKRVDFLEVIISSFLHFASD